MFLPAGSWEVRSEKLPLRGLRPEAKAIHAVKCMSIWFVLRQKLDCLLQRSLRVAHGLDGKIHMK